MGHARESWHNPTMHIRSQLVQAASVALIAILAAAGLVGCSNTNEASCTPGASVACTCPGSTPGTKTCSSSGAYGTCDCGSLTSDMGVAPDMTAGADMTGVADMAVDGRVIGDFGFVADDLGTCTTPAQCNDSNACTTDDCVSGSCVSTPISLSECADSEVCTDDVCDPELGCIHPFNSAPCSDGEYCSAGDHCADGICVSTTRTECSLGCVCNEAIDACESVHPGSACLSIDPA